jgi:hypothetical protein
MANQSIFSSTNLGIPFSNSQEYMNNLAASAITEFDVFNPYIHYYNNLPPSSSINTGIVPVTIDYRLEYEK